MVGTAFSLRIHAAKLNKLCVPLSTNSSYYNNRVTIFLILDILFCGFLTRLKLCSKSVWRVKRTAFLFVFHELVPKCRVEDEHKTTKGWIWVDRGCSLWCRPRRFWRATSSTGWHGGLVHALDAPGFPMVLTKWVFVCHFLMNCFKFYGSKLSWPWPCLCNRSQVSNRRTSHIALETLTWVLKPWLSVHDKSPLSPCSYSCYWVNSFRFFRNWSSRHVFIEANFNMTVGARPGHCLEIQIYSSYAGKKFGVG